MPLRLELKTIRPPSGDHTGNTSSAGSDVNRFITPRAVSSSQMSGFAPTLLYIATRVPSGDSDGSESVLEGSPTWAPSCPERLNQTNCRSGILELPRYAIEPVCDTEMLSAEPSVATCSAIGKGFSVSSSFPGSKACANDVPCSAYSTCPEGA
jgi:hypothetical protein